MRCLLSIIILLALLCGRVNAAVVATPEIRVITPAMSANTITGLVGSLPGYVMKHFVPGTYIIPTNRTSWWKPGVTNLFHFDAGAYLYVGHSSDGTGNALNDPHGIWWDSAGAGTLIVSGAGNLIVSNHHSVIVHIQQPTSRVELAANNLIRANTNIDGTIFIQLEGSLTANVLNDIENYGYDGYWNNGPGRCNIKAGRIYVGDTAIEAPGGLAQPLHFDIGVLQKRPNPHNRSTFLQFGENCFIRANIVDLGSNATVVSTGESLGPMGLLEANIIRCDPNSNRMLVSAFNNSVRIKGAHLYGADNTNVMAMGQDGFENGGVLENCTIHVGAGAAYAVEGNPGWNFNVVGELRTIGAGAGGGIQNGLVVNGGTLTWVHTNSYAGTNVFWSVDIYDKQVLLATNSMLVIVTNQPTLRSGKRGQLTVQNTKATNVNMQFVAGVRLFGAPMSAGAVTVTNGRTVRLDYELVGTNHNIMVMQQQN